ncbi:DUF7332 family protein [Halobaculum rubrum]|uniref:DUF7332 family protein n=1 Tax=Halobaculum rubrum TaxID=2872158 RepID=UPI001CA3BD34|nr:hypothetical protein [Halobaculum rubrum]QZX99920.1 hypothetical protein K6T25_02090 [Halobaculum rubrum]
MFALLVSLAGVDDPEAFLADPFPRFALAFDDTLSLPMLSAAPGESPTRPPTSSRGQP